MKISIKVNTKTKKRGVEKEKNVFLVSVKSPPTNGKANEEIIKVLAKHFNKSLSQVKIVSGLKSKNKIVEIL